MTDYKYDVYEAVCAALYYQPQMEFLGEQDREEGLTWWGHLGSKPKDMRVRVCRENDTATVTIGLTWRNYSADARNPLIGGLTITIPTEATLRSYLEQPVEGAIVRVLEVYRDVLAEEGVAGPIEKLVETEEREET